jgi:hypothetical protein
MTRDLSSIAARSAGLRQGLRAVAGALGSFTARPTRDLRRPRQQSDVHGRKK